jgi:hypothetical protein
VGLEEEDEGVEEVNCCAGNASSWKVVAGGLKESVGALAAFLLFKSLLWRMPAALRGPSQTLPARICERTAGCTTWRKYA